jgi:hypothetical protein
MKILRQHSVLLPMANILWQSLTKTTMPHLHTHVGVVVCATKRKDLMSLVKDLILGT